MTRAFAVAPHCVGPQVLNKGQETDFSTDGADRTFWYPAWQRRCSEPAYVADVGPGMKAEPNASYPLPVSLRATLQLD